MEDKTDRCVEHISVPVEELMKTYKLLVSMRRPLVEFTGDMNEMAEAANKARDITVDQLQSWFQKYVAP